VSNITFFYDMEADIQLMGLHRKSSNSVYQVYATYKEPWRSSQTGKVLVANLGANSQFTKIYDFTDSISKFGDNDVIRKIFSANPIADHYIFAG